MKHIALALFLVFVISCNTEKKEDKKDKKTKLTFTLKNYSREIVTLEEYSDESALRIKKGEKISKDKKGIYRVELDLKKPTYFRVGRNFLYLKPGDSLIANLDINDNNNATYKGINTAHQMYLNNTPYPKGGSFLGFNGIITSSLEQSLKNVELAAEKRKAKLEGNKELSKEFIALENARIKADIINSYKNMKLYYVMANRLPESKIDSISQEVSKLTDTRVKELAKDFLDTKYLQLESYQSVLPYLIENNEKESVSKTQLMDWDKVLVAFYGMMRTSDNEEITKIYNAVDSKITTEKYKKLFAELYKEYTKYGDGSDAADFTAVDVEGKKQNLSQFKGKVIYIDLWATWCVPCLKEMPHFNELAKEYQGKDIVFISVSIDNNLKAWKRNLTEREHNGLQWNVSRLNMDAYKLTGVPRLIVIDKDFKIVKYNAPEPSSSKTKEIIEACLAK